MKINRTTLRTIEILEIAARNAEGITLEDICMLLDIPKTSAYDIVTTLVHTGMLHTVKKDRQSYVIGLLSYQIGMSYTNHMDVVKTIEPQLRAFAKESGKTIFFGIESGQEVVYLSKYEPESPIITTATVGSKNPMYCTSLGKAILAALPTEEQECIMNRIDFYKRTDWTITTKEQLKKELEKIQACGYALDNRELEEHMLCVGAAVYGKDNKVIGAISCSSLYREDEDYRIFGSRVHDKAKEISQMLGYIA